MTAEETPEPRRVLIVDDEESDRVRLAAMLRDSGYQISTASSGREAVTTFADHPVAAVVTDIVMSDGDGVSLIAWLRSLSPTTPIVAISGKGPAGLAAAKALGADAILEKPVEPEVLVGAIGEAIEKNTEVRIPRKGRK